MSGSGANDKLSAEEAAQVVKGFLAFKDINAQQYPRQLALRQKASRWWVCEDSDDARKQIAQEKQQQLAEEEKKLNEARLVWDVIEIHSHNTAVVGAREQKVDTFVFNNSTDGEYLPHYGFRHGFNAIKKHFFRQSNAHDCGYCAAFFVIAAIKQVVVAEAKKAATEIIKELAIPLNNDLFSAKENPEVGPCGRDLAKLEAAFYLRCYLFFLNKQRKLTNDYQGLAQDLDKLGLALTYRLKKEKYQQGQVLLEAFNRFKQAESKDLIDKKPKERDIYCNALSYWLLYDFEFFCFLITKKKLGFESVSAMVCEYAASSQTEEKPLETPAEETCWVFMDQPSKEALETLKNPSTYYNLHIKGTDYYKKDILELNDNGRLITENFRPSTDPLKSAFITELEKKKIELSDSKPVAYRIKKSELADMIKRRVDGYFVDADDAMLLQLNPSMDSFFISESHYQQFSQRYKIKLGFNAKVAEVKPLPPVRVEIEVENDTSHNFLILGKIIGMIGFIAAIFGGIFILLASHFLLAYILLGTGGGLMLIGVASLVQKNKSEPRLSTVPVQPTSPIELLGAVSYTSVPIPGRSELDKSQILTSTSTSTDPKHSQ